MIDERHILKKSWASPFLRAHTCFFTVASSLRTSGLNQWSLFGISGTQSALSVRSARISARSVSPIASSRRGSTGVTLTLAMSLASGCMSTPRLCLPVMNDSRRVVPDPMNGSRTVSPSFE